MNQPAISTVFTVLLRVIIVLIGLMFGLFSFLTCFHVVYAHSDWPMLGYATACALVAVGILRNSVSRWE